MKKNLLRCFNEYFTPIPLNNGFYFVDNNGRLIDSVEYIPFRYVLPVEGVMIGIFFYLLLSHAIEHKTQLMFREKFKLLLICSIIHIRLWWCYGINWKKLVVGNLPESAVTKLQQALKKCQSGY